MITNEIVDKFTEGLYRAYGSETGVLFGIPTNLNSAVRAIVKVILNMNQEEVREATSKICGMTYCRVKLWEELNLEVKP